MEVLAWVHVEADMSIYHSTAMYQARQRCQGLPSWSYSFAFVS